MHDGFESAREQNTTINIGLEFQAIWDDVDLIDVRISAWNGTFGGVCCAYVGIGKLEEAAATLRGFPYNPSGTRELTFEGLGKGNARGDLGLRFYCSGGAGHAGMEAKIESAYDLAGPPQSVVLALPIEAAAIKLFVDQRHRLGATRSGIARLSGLVRL
jgi:hypothetical protein